MVGALSVAGWYFLSHGGGTSVAVAASDPPRRAADKKPAAKTETKAPTTRKVPKVSKDTLLSLGRVEYETHPAHFNRYVRVERGDTFFKLLRRAGVDRKEAHIAIATMSGIFNPRKIRPGRRIALSFGVLGGDQERFLGMRFDSAYDKTVQVQRQQNGDFVAAEVHKELTKELVRGDGTIESSLFAAGLSRGVPARAMIRMIHLFSFSVDFQRDIRKGDSFEVLFQQRRDDMGKIVRMGSIVYASLKVRGKVHKLYFFKTGKKGGEYFDENGESSRRALMRTPIDGARLSSGFGMRRHPILGYSRMHTGIDFAAPTGTPIYAAGDGTVVKAGWFGGYGRYIRIRHNRDYHTAYAHMVRFRKGMTPGRRVRQGEVIGYVGTTGRSTGPHLHYEVHYRGKPISPLTLKLPANKNLKGKELKRFLAYRKKLDAQFEALGKNGASDAMLAAKKAKRDPGCTAGGVRLDPTDKRPCAPADGDASKDGKTGQTAEKKGDAKTGEPKPRQEAAKP